MSIFKRQFKLIGECMSNMFVNTELGLPHSILREPSIVDEFYFESHQPSDDTMPSYSVVDPIIVLFNQQRLENMGVTAAKQFLDSLQPKSDSLAELRKKCSDEDLVTMIKSKYLQSPAEILAWCRYMKDNINTFNTEVQKLINAQQADEQSDEQSDEANTVINVNEPPKT